MKSRKSNSKPLPPAYYVAKQKQKYVIDYELKHVASVTEIESESEMESLIETESYSESTSHLVVGSIINNKYRVVSKLGEGAFGKVLEVVNVHQNKVYALKLVTNQQLQSDDDEVDIKKQAEICAYLNQQDPEDKQGIARLYDAFDYGGSFCMVYGEYGYNLYELLQMNQKGLPIHTVKEIFRSILLAVDFIHKNGVIHTDIKPHNILVETEALEMWALTPQDTVWLPKSHSVRIIDFGGAAKAGEEDNSYKIGTLIYRSPEALLQCSNWTKATDMWSIGCTIFQLVTNQPLFNTNNQDTLLAMMQRVSGRFPEWMINSATNLKSNFLRGMALKNFLLGKEFDSYLKTKPVNDMIHHRELQELLIWCLQIDPNHRPTCEEALNHEFFTTDCTQEISMIDFSLQ